jgi:hypothetical protein
VSFLAFHRGHIASVDPGLFGFEEAAEDLPERVLGNEAANSRDEGVAMGPSSRRTCSIRTAPQR